jgi:microcystin-dependent protein
MADQFVGEIRIFAGNFPPLGWAFCNGQLLSISQNTALFSLLGTQYGGDGRSNFGLPNLQGSVPIDQGQGPGLTTRSMGETGGQATVTLQATQMPAHQHVLNGALSPGGGTPSPTVALSAVSGGAAIYRIPNNVTPMAAQSIGAAGASQPHNNMQPFLTLNFIIAMQGIFPSRA